LVEQANRFRTNAARAAGDKSYLAFEGERNHTATLTDSAPNTQLEETGPCFAP
jgi:hypothetical protein